MSGPKGGRIRTQVRTQLVDRTLELARQLNGDASRRRTDCAGSLPLASRASHAGCCQVATSKRNSRRLGGRVGKPGVRQAAERDRND